MVEVIDLSAKAYVADVNTPFKKVQELRGLRNDEVISYYFTKMQTATQNRQAYLKQLDIFYFSVKPRLNSVVLKQLLFGNLDSRILKSQAMLYLKKAPCQSGYSESVFQN